jgi:signal transduction histidine kinase
MATAPAINVVEENSSDSYPAARRARDARAVSLAALAALLVVMSNFVLFALYARTEARVNEPPPATAEADSPNRSAVASRAPQRTRTKNALRTFVPIYALLSVPSLIIMSLWLHRGIRRLARAPLGDPSNAALEADDDRGSPDEKVHARAAELTQLSRHLIRVAEEEKAELARELHDTFGSNLTAINMDLNWIVKRLPAERPELKERLQRALGMLGATVRSTQEAIDRLRPSQLDNLGLAVALRSHCREVAQRVGLTCQIEAPEDFEGLDATRSITLYRVAQEALANVEKHAQAKTVAVELRREQRGIRLRIWDDGIGLPEEISSPSHGMVCMRERIEALGGTLIVTGVRERGTQVDAFIPANVP